MCHDMARHAQRIYLEAVTRGTTSYQRKWLPSFGGPCLRRDRGGCDGFAPRSAGPALRCAGVCPPRRFAERRRPSPEAPRGSRGKAPRQARRHAACRYSCDLLLLAAENYVQHDVAFTQYVGDTQVTCMQQVCSTFVKCNMYVTCM